MKSWARRSVSCLLSLSLSDRIRSLSFNKPTSFLFSAFSMRTLSDIFFSKSVSYPFSEVRIADVAVAFPVQAPCMFRLEFPCDVWFFRLAIERLRIMNLRSTFLPVVLFRSLEFFFASGCVYFLSGVTERPEKAKLAGPWTCCASVEGPGGPEESLACLFYATALFL